MYRYLSYYDIIIFHSSFRKKANISKFIYIYIHTFQDPTTRNLFRFYQTQARKKKKRNYRLTNLNATSVLNTVWPSQFFPWLVPKENGIKIDRLERFSFEENRGAIRGGLKRPLRTKNGIVKAGSKWMHDCAKRGRGTRGGATGAA